MRIAVFTCSPGLMIAEELHAEGRAERENGGLCGFLPASVHHEERLAADGFCQFVRLNGTQS